VKSDGVFGAAGSTDTAAVAPQEVNKDLFIGSAVTYSPEHSLGQISQEANRASSAWARRSSSSPERYSAMYPDSVDARGTVSERGTTHWLTL
jgi:hypothetical protein